MFQVGLRLKQVEIETDFFFYYICNRRREAVWQTDGKPMSWGPDCLAMPSIYCVLLSLFPSGSHSCKGKWLDKVNFETSSRAMIL